MTLNKPFLKWPGGKTWAVKIIKELLIKVDYVNYYEPFLGGGAVFFHISHSPAVLSDINSDLINTYLQVRDKPDELINIIQKMPVNKTDYYKIRATEPKSPIERAARFLYLNRTAFGGIYRLNKQGKFNVPYGGRKPNILWESNVLLNASKQLKKASILTSDFEPILRNVNKGDLVYCDPTYTVAHEKNGFVRYNERNFSWSDQVRLAESAKEAAKKGAKIMISNAYCESLLALYAPTKPIILDRYSCVSPHITSRRQIKESLFILD